MDAKNIAAGWGIATGVAIYRFVVALGILKRKTHFTSSKTLCAGSLRPFHYSINRRRLLSGKAQIERKTRIVNDNAITQYENSHTSVIVSKIIVISTICSLRGMKIDQVY